MPPELQFQRAVYDGDVPHVLQCAWCSRGLAHEEAFDANSKLICPVCALKALSVKPDDGPRVVWRSVAWGALVAAGAAVLLVTLTLWMSQTTFGWAVYLVAIVAGLAIGKAMRRAASGAGGRKFQVAAALLTYAAIATGLSAALLGVEGLPWYAYPLLPIAPIVQVFLRDMRQMALWELFLASIAIRWAWTQLPAWPLTIVAPGNRNKS